MAFTGVFSAHGTSPKANSKQVSKMQSYDYNSK